MNTASQSAQVALDTATSLLAPIIQAGDEASLDDLENALSDIQQAARNIIKERTPTGSYCSSSTVENLNFG